MSESMQIELVRALPTVLLILVAVGILFWLRRPFRDELLPRLGSIKVMWFELTLVQQEMVRMLLTVQGVGDPAKRTRWAEFDAAAQGRVLNRAEHIAPAPRGANLLWVDDRPHFNNAERNILTRLGVSVDIAITSQQCLALLAMTPNVYHAVISDMRRENNPTAGYDLLDSMKQRGYPRPVIFHVGTLKPGTPKGAFGICSRAGDLFHLVFATLERRRDWGRAPGIPAGTAQDV